MTEHSGVDPDEIQDGKVVEYGTTDQLTKAENHLISIVDEGLGEAFESSVHAARYAINAARAIAIKAGGDPE